MFLITEQEKKYLIILKILEFDSPIYSLQTDDKYLYAYADSSYAYIENIDDTFLFKTKTTVNQSSDPDNEHFERTILINISYRVTFEDYSFQEFYVYFDDISTTLSTSKWAKIIKYKYRINKSFSL